MIQKHINDVVRNIIQNAKGIIFDFDGVIADTEQLHAQSYVKLLKKYGVDFNLGSFSKYIGNSDLEILTLMQKQFGITLDIEKLRKERNEHFLTLTLETNLQPNDIVVEILKDAHSRSIPTIIISSQNRHVIDVLLKRWNLSHYFSTIYTVTELGIEKSKILMNAKDYLNLPPTDIIIIEDSAKTISAAKKMGMKTIGMVHALNNSMDISADILIQTKKY